MKTPNIVYIHTHDLGRYCQPMGYDIPAPNLMRLARQGTLFRQCHASAPSCAPSRAALVTGQYPHVCGMLGLPMPDMAYRLNDYSHHLAQFLHDQGYITALSGMQHVSFAPWAPPEEYLPYDFLLNHTPTKQQNYDPDKTVPAAVDFLLQAHDRPFFLSVGFLDPHRDNRDDPRIFIESQPAFEPADIDDRARYCLPWPHMPDNQITRREMANFKMGVELMDNDVGRILLALDTPELRANTLIIFTTDHGPGVCEMKCTLTDRGTGVMTIIRGPSDERYAAATAFNGGKVIDALTQHLDIFPTICDLIGAQQPSWLSGKSLMPLVTGEKESIHEVIFTEQTYHADRQPRPYRAVRSDRYKYIRCYDTALPRGVDRGPAQEFWEAHGYLEMPLPEEMLFDLVFDPHEAHNLADSPHHFDVLQQMRGHLRIWMEETKDPLLDGKIPEPPKDYTK